MTDAAEIAIHIALEIKQRIKSEIGDKMTCSIGIAKNKFLAKLASEKKKPDGLTAIDESNLDEMLLTSKLDDFCGIGRRISQRLDDIGISTVAQLRKIPLETLALSFGNVCGHHLHDMAFGIDESPVIPDFATDEQKSFSHSLTLDKATDDRKYVEAVLLRLCEKVARRMRTENFCGRLIYLYVRYSDTLLRPTFANASSSEQGYGGQVGGVSEQKLLSNYTNDGNEIFEIARNMFPKDFPVVRMISVGVGKLIKKGALTVSLLPEKQRAEKIVFSMDFANDRFGENSVFRAATLSAFDREKNVAGIRMKLRFQ
jgi:DNA polymerase-4